MGFLLAFVAACAFGQTTMDCSTFSGANEGLKINACLASLPSQGGVADATKLNGGTWNTNIYSGITVPSKLYELHKQSCLYSDHNRIDDQHGDYG